MREELKEVNFFNSSKNDTNLSMSIYAKKLLTYINTNRPGIRVEVYSPLTFKYPAFISRAVDRIPLLRFYGRELFVSCYFIYPFTAKRRQAQLNHILDHSVGHLIYSLDPKRTVITCHDLQPIAALGVRYPKKPKWLRWFERSIKGLDKAARVIVVSNSTKSDVLKYTRVRQENIRVIYNGVDACFRVIDSQILVRKVREKYGLGEIKGEIILNVGSCQRRKNIEGVLQALKTMRDKGHDFVFVHVGQNMHMSQRQLVYDLGLSDIVYDLGYLPVDDLVLLYNTSSVLLFPSFYEGFGWPIVEAFSCGIPVVTSNISSMPEIADDAALLVDPENPVAIAGAALNILTNANLRIGLIEKGLKRVKDFSWEKNARDLLKVYDEVLSAG